MTPRFHEEFVALCALFYSGEISDEEWALLQVHLAYCDSCRREFEQYQQIHETVIPAMAAVAAQQAGVALHETSSAFARAESRLMNSLGDAPKVAQEESVSRTRSFRTWGGALAACVLVIAAFAFNRVEKDRKVAQQMPIAQSSAKNPTRSLSAFSNSSDILALQQSQEEVTRLRQQIASLENKSEPPDPAVNLQRQIYTEQAQHDELLSERDTLNAQLATARASIQALTDRITAAESNSGQQTVQIAALEAKVHSLNSELEDTNSALADRERMLTLDKDFLTHDRDIRDLIGARDLYIADIFDTNESGKTAKPFGRIFYTRDRSLVFYGFDLEKQSGLKQAVAFQAWGTGNDSQPVNLGLFYQDDSHKRWVLRFSDAKALSRLNMVFVTVEPPGGSNKPTGKQLLRAYLQIQPNHP